MSALYLYLVKIHSRLANLNYLYKNNISLHQIQTISIPTK